MFHRPSARVVTALLLSTLVFVPGCEPDECSVDFTYTVNGTDTYQYIWRHPDSHCSYVSFDGEKVSFVKGTETVDITFSDTISVGEHPVELIYLDENGKSWASIEGISEEFDSDCIATVDSVEFVDWVRYDHLRVRGSLACEAPLSDPLGEDELEIDELRFLIYTIKYF